MSARERERSRLSENEKGVGISSGVFSFFAATAGTVVYFFFLGVPAESPFSDFFFFPAFFFSGEGGSVYFRG